MVLKRTIAAIFALIALVGSARAGEVQGKVWSVTDLDGMAFCDKCDPDAIPSQTRVENYRRTIVDTVAMGANAILVQTRPGVERQVRMAEFAQALAAHNLSAAPADRACMAVMYADYGTSFSDSDLSGFFASAWSDDYCLLAGRPVVATLDDRSDQSCLASKHANMIARLRTLPSASAPTALNWIAAFGDRGEYTAWASNCRDKITPSGFPVSYSYLEMANDDPAFATDATSRGSAVKAGGGIYILGLPAASAQNCGDFCGSAFDRSAPTHTDFSGFGRLLSAWRAGADHVAYTYGPGGPAWLDQAAGSAIRCGPNDLVTPDIDCVSVAAADRALIPGAPSAATGGGGGEEPPPPPTGAQCAGATPPPAASAKGMTELAFCEDFSDPSRINLTGALNDGQTITQVSSGNIFNTYPMPASAFSFSNGEMRVVPTRNKYQIDLITTKPTGGGSYKGYAMTGGNWYVEMRWKHDDCGSSGGFPAFWSMDVQKIYRGGPDAYEPDFYEYISRRAYRAIHWYPNPGSNTGKVSIVKSHSISNVTSFFTVAARMSDNGTSYRWYLNDAEVKSTAVAHPSDAVRGEFPIMIGGGTPGGVGCKYTIDWVRAWEKP